MNLVNELQESAETDDVLTVLRKAKRLASKLELDDVAEWLKSEQSGYEDSDSVPDYRRIGTRLAFNTNGLIPAGFGQLMNGVQDLPAFGFETTWPVNVPISMVNNWISQGADRVYFPIESGSDSDRMIRKYFQTHPAYERQISYLVHLNGSQILAIPERIKDRVMDWALALERATITGEGMTFSEKEKQLAHNVTFNIIGSTIEQLNNAGTNKRTDA